MPTTKDARRSIRLRAADDSLIALAADHAGQTVTEFMTTSAVERAQQVLADVRSFEVDHETWINFTDLLEQPVKPDPRLVELFTRPQRIRR